MASSELKVQLLETFAALITAAFGLVAALAWNETIKTAVAQVFGSPLSEQQRIVSELDLLSTIIEKKKAQLKEYDQLAQSIFYDMFGDPVTNEKGWEVKKLGEVCEKITDGTHNSPINTERGDFMYITAKNIKKDGIILNNITYVSADVHKSIYERCNPQYGDVLYIKDGITTGIATINTLREEFSLLTPHLLPLVNGCLSLVFHPTRLFSALSTVSKWKPPVV